MGQPASTLWSLCTADAPAGEGSSGGSAQSKEFERVLQLALLGEPCASYEIEVTPY